MTTTVTYPSPDGTIDAALARPSGGGRHPAVLMLTDIRGVRDVYRDMAERLAGHGYVVLVPNLYHRLPKSEQPVSNLDFSQPEVREKMFALKDGLTRDRIVSDTGAAIAFLDAQPFVQGPRLGVVGYCMSAAFALWTAAGFRDRVVAAAGFHGGGLATDKPDSPHRLTGLYAAEIYLGHADKDAMLPPEQIAALDAALTEAQARFTTEVYPASHGYAIADNAAYDEAAAERHWTALTGLLARTL